MKRIALFGLAAILCMSLSGCGDKPGPDNGDKEGKTKKDFVNPPVDKDPIVDYTKWEVHDGKFYLDGKWTFIKAAKPLTDYSNPECCENVIGFLDKLREKHYNAVSLNVDWSVFDSDADGVINKSVEPLRRVIDEIYKRGMLPCLNMGIYSVGGNAVPAAFYERYPDADAINEKGEKVNDTEYGFGNRVVSIFHEAYRETSRKFMKDIISKLDGNKLFYIETTVEPQYMGAIKLCYSESARKEYAKWRKENGITDPESEMPEGFPIPDSFVKNATWNKFRAQFLARWVNEDAEAIRSAAGDRVKIAVDYLDAGESSMIYRCGDPEEFLMHLTCPDIIQVNWHWYFPERKPNQKAYDRVWKVMKATGRDWAITEHMTFNGSDYGFSEPMLDMVLENTLHQGTRFGWEFTNTFNRDTDSFSLYHTDWTPKRTMANVDDNWGYWLYRAAEVEREISGK